MWSVIRMNVFKMNNIMDEDNGGVSDAGRCLYGSVTMATHGGGSHRPKSSWRMAIL